MPKKAFTLIEIVIVIALIGILMISFKQIFQLKNKDVLYGQTCSNYIYGDLNNFINSAITNKALYSGNTQFFPNYYIISFSTEQNTINLNYQQNNGLTGTRKSLNLSGDIPSNYQCNKTEGIIKISGDNSIITIKKWLQQTENLPSFMLTQNWSMVFTGTIPIYACSINNKCKNISKINIDSRSKSLTNHNCLVFTWENKLECHERN